MGPADDMSMRTPLSDQRKILPSARGNDFARALNSSQEARDLLPLHLGDLERDKNNLYANVEIKGRSRILPGDARNQHMFLSKQTISRTHKRLKGRFLSGRNRIKRVFWIFFSERWQSTLFQIFLKQTMINRMGARAARDLFGCDSGSGRTRGRLVS